MAKVLRGKALVASLRRRAGVRDAEALAAWIGRYKKARNGGASPAEARRAADGHDSRKRAKKILGAKKRGYIDASQAVRLQKQNRLEKERTTVAARKAMIAEARKSEKAKEDEYHKQYEQFFAGTEGRRTIADSIPLRRGMEVQFKDRPTPGDKNPEVVKVHGPNEVEVRLPDGTRKKYRRTELLLVAPQHSRNKKPPKKTRRRSSIFG